ncbi:hypothetical protein [Nitrospira sp. BLG_2]|uniref:hypothetical protein n=1 Tax=Nitrospira sp. BLG_2 TaxID=3397507 RepID=UPI003B9AF115
MYYSVLQRTVVLVGILFWVSLSLGCTNVVRPISSSEGMTTEDKQGILVGGIHLAQNDKELSADHNGSMYMKWWIQEETHGTDILLSRLPLDGPFAVKLPVGSYRVTDVSLHTSKGIWHIGLPKSFTVHSGECTSLGVWKLEPQSEFRSGWLTPERVDERGLTQNDRGHIIEPKGCTLMTAPHSNEQSAMRVSLYRWDELVRP